MVKSTDVVRRYVVRYALHASVRTIFCDRSLGYNCNVMQGATAEMDDRLFKAVVNGSLWDYCGPSKAVTHVDEGDQKVLVQAAIMYGRLDSLVWMLVMGLHPGVILGEDSSTLDMAKAWEKRFPGEENRSGVVCLLRILKAMSGRESDTKDSLPPSSFRKETTRILGEALKIMPTFMLKWPLLHRLAEKTSPEPEQLRTDHEVMPEEEGLDLILSDEAEFFREALKIVPRLLLKLPLVHRGVDVASWQPKRVRTHLLDHQAKLREEVRKSVLSWKTEESVRAFEKQIKLYDLQLMKLVGRVNLLVGEVRMIKDFVVDLLQMSAWSRKDCMPVTELLSAVSNARCESDGVKIRGDCIADLIRRTELLKRNKENVSRVEEIYEKLYDGSLLTRCLLRYLQLKADVQFVIDFDSYHVGDLKSCCVDVMERRCKGSSLYSYADTKEKVVYLGGKVSSSWSVDRVIGQYAMSLAQMCFALAFDYSGLPYHRDCSLGFHKLLRALGETKEGWRVEDNRFDGQVRDWVKGGWDLEKQVRLVAAVPGMVATFGSIDGILRARRKMRALTEYYEEYVVPALFYEDKETKWIMGEALEITPRFMSKLPRLPPRRILREDVYVRTLTVITLDAATGSYRPVMRRKIKQIKRIK